MQQELARLAQNITKLELELSKLIGVDEKAQHLQTELVILQQQLNDLMELAHKELSHGK